MVNPLSNAPYLLPPLITAVGSLILLALVVLRGRKNSSTRIFYWLLASVGLTSFFIFGMRSSPDIPQAFLWQKPVLVVTWGIFLFYYHFTVVYTNARVKMGILLAIYALVISIAVLGGTTGLVLEGVRLEYYGYAPTFTTLGLFLLTSGSILHVAGAYNLIKGYKRTASIAERNRLLYLAIAILFPLLGGLLDGFTNLPPALIWGNLMFCIICTIAIVKYQLLDIRIVFQKSLVYILVSGMIAVPYVVTLVLLNQLLEARIEPWWVHALIILLLAILLRPLYSRAQNLVDRIFYRDRYDYLRALEQFSHQAQSVLNLEELGLDLVRLVRGALRTSSACLLLSSKGKDGLVVASSTGLASPPSGVVLRNDSPLAKWLELHGEILSSEQLNIVPQVQALSLREKNNLEKMGANLFVPIKKREGELSGVLILGPKTSQQTYSNEDKQLLIALSSQMSAALQNARLYSDALRARENLETWLNSMSDCVMIANTEYTIQFMNKAAGKKFGARTGEKCWKALRKDTMCSSCPIQHYLRGNRDGLHYSENIGDREYDIAAAPLLNPDGALSIIEVLRDVTERKQAEVALRKSEKQASAAIEAARALTFNYDIASGKIEWGGAIEEITGYTRKEFAKIDIEGWANRIHPDDRDEVLSILQEAMGKDRATAEYRFETKKGYVTLSSISLTEKQDGKAIRLVGILQDITERKQAEEKEKRLQQQLYLSSRLASIGELAAGVAHEINNPLTGILGFSQRLLRKSTDKEVSQDLARIHKEALRAAKVVQNLLTFARRPELKKQYCDINDILQKALELRAYELKTGNIEVVTDLVRSLPKIMVDFHQIQQVFLNIIMNAEQAMTETYRGGKLSIRTQQMKGHITISFTDDGPGIPAGNLSKVFDLFFTMREKPTGTGLGLSICHGIVTSHGGKIYAKSEVGKGATFFVELPIMAEAADRNQVAKEDAIRGSHKCGSS